MSVRFLFLTFLIFSLSACEISRNMDEMHGDTRKMVGQTEELGKTSDELKLLTREMYKDMRQGSAALARDKFLTTLKSARSMAEKYSAAAEYLASFEFQIWSSIGEDTVEQRQHLMTDAAKQFILVIQEFAYSGQTQPEPMAVRADVDGAYIFSAIDDANNRQQCLNALAAALHFINPKQERLIQLQGGLNTVSMYSMFEETFDLIGKLRRNEIDMSQVPPHAYEIMKYPDVAALVMRARYNTLGFVVTYQVAGLQDESMTFSLSGGADVIRWRWPKVRWNILRHTSFSFLGSPWKLNYDAYLPPQKDEFEKLMKLGMATRDVLKRNGYNPGLVPAVKAVMTDLELTARQKMLVEPETVLAELDDKDRREAEFLKIIFSY